MPLFHFKKLVACKNISFSTELNDDKFVEYASLKHSKLEKILALEQISFFNGELITKCLVSKLKIQTYLDEPYSVKPELNKNLLRKGAEF